MIALIQVCCLLITMLFTSGCTINQFRQSVPYKVDGDGWSLSTKWAFLTGAGTVSGHGLDFDIIANNEDIVSELWMPTKGRHKLDPFIISVYINHIDGDLLVNWKNMKVISNGKEYIVRDFRGPYSVTKTECNPWYTNFRNPEWTSKRMLIDITANACLFIEFNATNSDVLWRFQTELIEINKSRETVPSLKILFSEQ